MTTKPLIAGNWKMNLNHLEAIALVQKVAFSLPEKYFAKVDVTVLPPFTDLRSVQTLVDGDKLLVSYGAQDLSPYEPGAYTGEVSGSMLAKLGCSFVTVGHSERRQYHAEDDALVNKKVAAAIKHELSPILCVGEPVEVREAGEHIEHCTSQLLAGLKGLTAQQVAEQLVIAYEPVWAIGTGRVATPADAQEVCAALRSALVNKYGEQASGVRVLYGGSVKSKNIGELVGQADIDGALVGGASTDADEFTKLCALAAGGPLP